MAWVQHLLAAGVLFHACHTMSAGARVNPPRSGQRHTSPSRPPSQPWHLLRTGVQGGRLRVAEDGNDGAVSRVRLLHHVNLRLNEQPVGPRRGRDRDATHALAMRRVWPRRNPGDGVAEAGVRRKSVCNLSAKAAALVRGRSSKGKKAQDGRGGGLSRLHYDDGALLRW